MERFLQYLFVGLAAGSSYALVALGLVLVYQASRVLNFAHGEIAVFATFIAYTLMSAQLPFGLAAGAALASGAAIAAAFYWGMLIPAQRRDVGHLSQVIMTLGLSLILQGAASFFWGAEPQAFRIPLSETKIRTLGPVSMSELSLGTLGIGLLCALLLYLLIQRTRVGKAMRAISENLVAAQTLGIPTRPLLALSWALAALLGARSLNRAVTFSLEPGLWNSQEALA